ncbi:T9SS type A sorting domain-containing protein [Aquimarina sp. TRL1]|uniref:T9SS type A sorting domain-containing protein n=1 Tax=Aquimarina sp. (strain TRL1) TaxID=2736252 RepID=UPI00158E3DCA|nr:T9SS type A sorting domain-containing protein [Aquimarina sp. TRL1]QKX05081.1 T9SS type A sorting domain-containing protein [Aquimarina sp. TRL1]
MKHLLLFVLAFPIMLKAQIQNTPIDHLEDIDFIAYLDSDDVSPILTETSIIKNSIEINSPPVISDLNGDTFTYTEGDGSRRIDQGSNLTITDTDSPDFDGGNLTISITSGIDIFEDLLSFDTTGAISFSGATTGSNISVGGVTIGTLGNNISTGNDLIVNFNANATITHIESLTRAIIYENTDNGLPTPGARNIRVTLHDGDGGASAPSDISINVVEVNDVPVTINLNGDSYTYNEGDGSTNIDQGAPLFFIDVDSPDLNGGNLTVSVTSGKNPSEDLLSFSGTVTLEGTTTGSNVTVGGSIIGTLGNNIASGNDLIVHFNTSANSFRVQTLIQAITYENTNTDNPSTAPRTIKTTINDGDGGTSPDANVTVTITDINDPPYISNLTGDSFIYTEGDGQRIIDQGTNIILDDIDTPIYNGGHLKASISNGSAPIEDILSLATTGNISLSGTTSGSTVSVEGVPIGHLLSDLSPGNELWVVFNGDDTATLSKVQTLLRAITYENSNTDNPITGPRTISVTVFDGIEKESPPSEATITVTATNDPPVIHALNGGAWTYTEGDGPRFIDRHSSSIIFDVDSPDFDGGNLSIEFISGKDASEDFLSIDTSGNISLSGTSYGSSVTIGGTTIGSLGSTIATGNNLIINLNTNATFFNVQNLLHAIQYQNINNETPTTGARNIRVTINDGDGGTSSNNDLIITVDNQNDPPTISNVDGDTFTYTEGDNNTLVDQNANASINDVDSPNFEGGNITVTITTGKDPEEDVLSLDTSSDITLSGTTAGSTISINGTLIGTLGNNIAPGNDLIINFNADATPTRAQILLRGITYNNTNNQAPTTDTRNISISINDGDGGTSATSNITISILAANDPPEINNLNGDVISYTEEEGKAILDQEVTAIVSDVDSPDFDKGSLYATITSGKVSSEDILSIDISGIISLSGTNAGSNIIVSGTTIGTLNNTIAEGNDLLITFNTHATLNSIQSVLQAITYENINTDNPATNTRNIEITLNDGDGGTSTPSNITVDINNINDVPIITHLNNDSYTYIEGNGNTLLDQNNPAGVSDVDSFNFEGGVLLASITSGKILTEDLLSINTSGVVSLSGTNAGSNVIVSGTTIGTLDNTITEGNDLAITFNPNATADKIQKLVQALSYENTNTSNITVGSRTLHISISDGDGGTSALSVVKISVISSNTPPTSENLTISSIYQNIAYTFSLSQIIYSDPDNDPLDHIRITTIPSGNLWIDTNNNNNIDNTETIITPNTIVPRVSLENNLLKYHQTDNINTSFDFEVNDGTVYSTHTYTADLLVIPFPEVYFSNDSPSSPSIQENKGTSTITVALSHAYGADVIIHLDYTASTATYAQDFDAQKTIVIPAGNTHIEHTITSIDDLDIETNESIIITFNTVENAHIRENEINTVIITDNDTNLPPSVLLSYSGATPTNASPITIQFDWNSEVIGFSINDITSSMGILSNFTVLNSKTYKVDIIPITEGIITVYVNENTVTDITGTSNNKSEILTIEYKHTLHPAPEVPFSIHPIPASEIITLTADTNNYLEVARVYNSQGALVLEKKLNGNRKNNPIDISVLSAGIYFIETMSKKDTFTYRIIKQ